MTATRLSIFSATWLASMTLLWTAGCRSESVIRQPIQDEGSAPTPSFSEITEYSTELSSTIYTDQDASELSSKAIGSRAACEGAFADLIQKPFPESPYSILIERSAHPWTRAFGDPSLGDISAEPQEFRILSRFVRTYLVQQEETPVGGEVPKKHLVSESVELSCPLPVSWSIKIPGFEIQTVDAVKAARVCEKSSLDEFFPGKCNKGYDLTSSLVRWRDEIGESCSFEYPGAPCKGDDFSNSRHYLPLALKAVSVDDAQQLRDRLLLSLGLPAGTPARVEPASSRFEPQTRNTPLRVVGFAGTEKGVPALWLGTRDTCARSGRGCDRILPFNQDVRPPQASDLASPEKFKEFLATFQQAGIGLFNINPWNSTSGSYPDYHDGSLAHINEISARLNTLLASTWDRNQPIFMSLLIRFEKDGPVYLQKLRVAPEGESALLGGPERLSAVKPLGLNTRAL